MMASKARPALSAILASDDPREQNRLGRQVRHVDPALWQDESEAIVLRGNPAKFSLNEEMRVALENKCARRITEASPHDKVWGIGLIASDLRSASPISWCGPQILGQALEHARDSLRQNTSGNPNQISWPQGTIIPEIRLIDPITHVRVDRSPLNTPTNSAQRRLPIRCPMIMPLRYDWLMP